MNSIACILPKGEGFSEAQFGAIALCVRDFTQHSRYKATTTVIGGVAGSGFEGIKYSAMPPARWFENRTRAYARACAQFIRDEHIALAEIHNRPHLLCLIAPRITCKIALHLHNDPQEMQAAHTPRERRKLLELCDGIYCVSHYIRERFSEGLDGAAQQKLHVVYNGIDIPPTVPAKEKIIVFAGRMTEGKGALLLAEALRLALPQLPGWRAVLIGSRRHEAAQSLTEHEREIARMLSPLAAQIKMPGFLSHPETLGFFARAEIAVVPSVWQEPFGRTAIEAMAQGCALISSGRGGLREVTQESALTPRTLTAQSLADAITTLADNADERERLQKLARVRAMYFSIAERTQTLDDARAAILESDKSAP